MTTVEVCTACRKPVTADTRDFCLTCAEVVHEACLNDNDHHCGPGRGDWAKFAARMYEALLRERPG